MCVFMTITILSQRILMLMELNNNTNSLSLIFPNRKFWVAWKEQLNKQGKLIQDPERSATGDNAGYRATLARMAHLTTLHAARRRVEKVVLAFVSGQSITSTIRRYRSRPHVVTSTPRQSPIGRQNDQSI